MRSLSIPNGTNSVSKPTKSGRAGKPTQDKAPKTRGKPVDRAKPSSQQTTQPTKPPRLQRVLASAGLGSRRSCEELIVEGRVEIDGKTVTELGVRVDVDTQKVRVDGELLKIKRQTYYVVNKPVGVVSTNSDPAGRMRVVDLVPGGDEMFTVGRLDMSSSGLMLVTNDGELANRLAHPRYEVTKTYKVTVAGHPGPEELKKLRTGIHLAEGPVRVTSVRIKGRQKQNTLLEIVLSEGRNREIRRMAARIGHKVLKLERIAIGPLRLGEMPQGAYRMLTADELRSLQRSVSKRSPRARRRNQPTGRTSTGQRMSGPKKGLRTKTTRTAKSTKATKGGHPSAGRTGGRRGGKAGGRGRA